MPIQLALVNGECLDLPNGASANGTKLHALPCNAGGMNQAWYMDSTGAIHPAANPSKCLDLPSGQAISGTQLQLWDCDNGASQNQTWTYESDLTIQKAGKCVGLPADNVCSGAPVELLDCNKAPTQQWFTYFGTASQPIQLHNGNGGCIHLPNGTTTDGTLIEIRACDPAGVNQTWFMDSGGTIHYAPNPLKCINLVGTQLQIWTCFANGPNGNEVWAYGLDNTIRDAEQCLEPLHGIPDGGNPIVLSDCHGTNGQQWFPMAVGETSRPGTGKHSRGTNTQILMPQNIQLADLDNDGIAELVQFSGNIVSVSKPDGSWGSFFRLAEANQVTRVLVGDFAGFGYDQLCTIQSGTLRCYELSWDAQGLVQWFSQPSWLSDNEDAIVADYSGDGRSSVLVFPKAGGPYHMYKVMDNSGFQLVPTFLPFHGDGDPDNLPPGTSVRAGDFNGDGRADLLVINHAGQILYYRSANDGTVDTFSPEFSTESGFVREFDQVTIARIDNDAIDDVVLHNESTGETRFFKMAPDRSGFLAIEDVEIGHIPTGSNHQLFWKAVHGMMTEPGGYYREDVFAYDTVQNALTRTDARAANGSDLTYWWCYGAYAPIATR